MKTFLQHLLIFFQALAEYKHHRYTDLRSGIWKDLT